MHQDDEVHTYQADTIAKMIELELSLERLNQDVARLLWLAGQEHLTERELQRRLAAKAERMRRLARRPDFSWDRGRLLTPLHPTILHP